MSIQLETIVKLLERDKFLKVTNTEDFPELSQETRNILKNYGLPTYEYGTYPRIVTDGKLKRFTNDLIEIGIFPVMEDKYCIDISDGEKVVSYDLPTQEIRVVNSSLKKFLECKYTMAYYYRNIEFAKKYGDYNEGNNHKKYAKILRDMLNEVEPNIEQYETWEDELFQKELGVI
jgi:hypothetical protein